MLQKLRHLSILTSQFVRNQDLHKSVINDQFLKTVCNFCRMDLNRNFYTSKVPRSTESNLESKETSTDVSNSEIPVFHKNRLQDILPTYDIYTKQFNGVEFSKIPILYIKVSKNNVILNLVDHKGEPLITKSCGTEGFKNCKKGSSIAAHTVGLSFAKKSLKYKINNVRVIIKGLGVGKMAVLKGLEFGGLQMISLTDYTNDARIQRPKKARRI